jgi:signal transduction histidine kinase
VRHNVGGVMSGDVNCIFTKVLIPYLEREVGPDAVAAVCQMAGHSRDYLMADHNWIPLPLMDRLVRLAMQLMGESDEERWARRFAEFCQEWKPSREERSFLGTYGMALYDPRTMYQRATRIWSYQARFLAFEAVSVGRRQARFRWTPAPGITLPRWACVWFVVQSASWPTNWHLPRAQVVERQCAAKGDAPCVVDVEWRNPLLGPRFWAPLAGGAGAGLLSLTVSGLARPWLDVGLAVMAALAGTILGCALVLRERLRRSRRGLDLQAEEVLYSNDELATKFRDLEGKIEQLSLLIDLSAAVNATLDPEKIYEQAVHRLVEGMGYQSAHLFLVDTQRHVVRGHKAAGAAPAVEYFERVELPLDPGASAVARVATSGLPLVVDDVDASPVPIHVPTVRAFDVRSFVAVPLTVKGRVFGVLNVDASEPHRFTAADVELVSAVGNHVALAIDRAESFRTIEGLTRGLEDKVRVRTEELRAANEELQAAYRELQATQMRLVQREKMASVGQLVAGVAHELNNPIGFVFSNVSTLDDFVGRLRAMLDEYRSVALPESERARLDERRGALKVDYALKYLDSMIQGIREGAERARKIVQDLRIFARDQDEVWQPVDLREELESSLTLLNHLLKDRVAVHRKLADLPAVECIRSQIDQVLLNLLANAGQAIPGSGEITVETRVENGEAVVAIGDTGPGIPPEIIGRVFDPFFTTKPVGEGTGLGLSISYEIVKKHGGEITAESPPGGGAVFTVRLPLTRRAPAIDDRVSRGAEPDTRGPDTG